MRLLHTSDWHLGRGFHRVSLRDAQERFLDHLVATAREEKVDAVLVAGDVYDRAVPPLSAVELFDDALHRLGALGVPTIMISGNHDSARRLGVGAGLLGRAGVHLRTDPAGCANPVLLADEHGEIAFYGLPYLEPSLVRTEFDVEHAGHAAVLGAAMDRVRADLATRPGTRSVVLAHAFVVGGEPCDSERDITAGGVAAVPVGVFGGVDYVALGHLHRCQSLSERVRYSGSPLAYSFSEADHRKSMWLLDLGPDGRPHAERIDCPVPRRLARVRGGIEELLADQALAPLADAWLEVTLTDAVRPAGAMARLAERFPHVLNLVFDPEDTDHADGALGYADRLRGRDDHQITADFVAHVRGGRGPDDAERALLRDALETARVHEAAREATP
ncbi:exonuclease SbcCD subunit D [Streptomyces alkaliterrae]|uniref:Nuclease SbcCD subunit D n=1 Tax=Streptomyces alkaliterrae TaxID=2213162 RepID=A0A5P0YQ47_9ACTN|nr:exonuclease SbcCD subunit D [Streptomyces alkaliterrae]MBB1257346.1 exonuclease SbcCD subunit D [Streptomyces alkaliterrae]MQS02040.1 exonuclease subunit SbcD [Streptomyces alkaliterrae]